MWVSGGIYKNWYLDVLEGSFALMSPTSSLPDRLINPGDYEPPFNTLQRLTIVKTTEGVTDAQKKRIIPAYTYGSID